MSYKLINKKINDKQYNERYNKNKIYLIECYSDDEKERFLKIGFTRLKYIKDRFKKDFPYNWRVIKVLEIKNAEMIERTLHTIFNGLRYKPNKNFSGKTECYDIKYLELFKELIDSFLVNKYVSTKPKKKKNKNNKKELRIRGVIYK